MAKTKKTTKTEDKKPAGAPVLVMGHTLSDIARGTELTPSYVSRLHRGKRLPSLTALDAIAKFLGCTTEEARAAFATAPPPEGKRGASTKAQAKPKAKPQAKAKKEQKAKPAKLPKAPRAAKTKKVKTTRTDTTLGTALGVSLIPAADPSA